MTNWSHARINKEYWESQITLYELSQITGRTVAEIKEIVYGSVS